MAYLLFKDKPVKDNVPVTNTPIQQDQELVDFLEQLVNCKAIWYTDLRYKAEALLEKRLAVRDFHPKF